MRHFLSRFMYGRYGSDMLNLFLLVAGLLFYFLGLIIPLSLLATLFRLLSFVAVGLTAFRMLSRDYGRRREENDRFVQFVSPMVQSLQRRRAQRRDKDHAYFRCPSCGQTLRVPRGKNRITITCRNSGTDFQKKT